MEQSPRAPVKFKAGEVIVHENSAALYLYVIKSGQVQVVKAGDQGEIPIAIVNSGQYLGELAMLSGSHHTATAKALTEVEAIQISREAIEAQLKQIPGWLYALIRTLAERLIKTNDVLRRNNIVDEHLSGAITAAETNAGIR